MKLFKLLFLGAFLTVLLVIGLAFLALSQVNNLVRRGVEAGGTYAMGVPTTLHTLSMRPLSGTATVRGFEVANPPGYQATEFFRLGEGSLALTLASLNQPVIEVPALSLSEVRVSLERREAKANYQVILENIKNVQDRLGGGGGGASTTPSGPETKVVVNELTIRDVVVSVDMLGASGGLGEVLNKATKVTIPIDEIRLQNVGKTGTGVGGTGVTVSQLASIVVQAVLGAAADKGGGLLPADLLNDLQGQLGGLDGLKDLGMSVLAGKGGKVEEFARDAGAKVEGAVKGAVKGAVEGAAKEAEKGLKGLGEGLKGLIPGQKKDEPKGGG